MSQKLYVVTSTSAHIDSRSAGMLKRICLYNKELQRKKGVLKSENGKRMKCVLKRGEKG